MNPHRVGPISHERRRVKQREAKEHRRAAAFERVVAVVNPRQIPIRVAELNRASDSRGSVLNPSTHAADVSPFTAVPNTAHFHHDAVQTRDFHVVLHIQIAGVLVARLLLFCLLEGA